MNNAATSAPATWRVIGDDGQRDPRVNLALDEALARHVAAADRTAAPTPCLRIWRSDPSVIVGRFQVAGAEVDGTAAAIRRAPVLRRFTGGGTVWHDPGNVCISIVLRPDDALLAGDAGRRQLPGLYTVVLEPLAAAARSLGAPEATATDRDVVTPRGKLSGIAAWIGGRAILVHGTLLVDADLDALVAVCAGPGAEGDPRWERTKSRRVPVTSVARERAAFGLGPPPTSLVDTALLTAVAKGAAAIEPSSWSAGELELAQQLLKGRYANPEWHADRDT